MTRILLIRHASCNETGHRLHGRMGGIVLNEQGRQEAERLAQRLAGEPLSGVVSSPRERARQTAQAMAAPHGLQPAFIDGLDEFDFGSWTGHTLDELHGRDDWTAFNTLRSVTPAAGGELMVEVQARAVRAIVALRTAHPGGCVAAVTHGDVIRAIVAHVLGVPLDNVLRLGVDPASVTELRFHGAWPQLHSLNSV